MTADSDDVAESADEKPEGALRRRGAREAPAHPPHPTGEEQAAANAADESPA